MSWFFAWVYQANHPTYANTYNITNLGNGQWQVAFKARQSQTNTGFFPMPLTLKVSFAVAGTDTTFRVMNSVNNQVFTIRFNRQPTSVAFDPNNDIVIKQGTTSVGATLSTPTLVSPANGSSGSTLAPLVWNIAPSAATYRVQVATDSLFAAIVVDDSTVTDTTRALSGLTPDVRYFWRVNAKNGGGTTLWSTGWSFTLTTTGVSGTTNLPAEFSLSQNYPNPFNPNTVIRYGLPRASHVNVAVFNVLGQQIAVLDEGYREAGYHDVTFSGKNLASGVYLYRIVAGEYVQTRKFILMK
jgi:hypothetical protein